MRLYIPTTVMQEQNILLFVSATWQRRHYTQCRTLQQEGKQERLNFQYQWCDTSPTGGLSTESNQRTGLIAIVYPVCKFGSELCTVHARQNVMHKVCRNSTLNTNLQFINCKIVANQTSPCSLHILRQLSRHETGAWACRNSLTLIRMVAPFNNSFLLAAEIGLGDPLPVAAVLEPVVFPEEEALPCAAEGWELPLLSKLCFALTSSESLLVPSACNVTDHIQKESGESHSQDILLNLYTAVPSISRGKPSKDSM